MEDKENKQAFLPFLDQAHAQSLSVAVMATDTFFFLVDQRRHGLVWPSLLWMSSALGGWQWKVVPHVQWVSNGFILKQALSRGFSFPAMPSWAFSPRCSGGSAVSLSILVRCLFIFFHIKTFKKTFLYLEWYWQKWEKQQPCLQTHTQSALSLVLVFLVLPGD